MPALDPSTFEYLKPTDEQIEHMATLRFAFSQLAHQIEAYVPEGQDRDYAMRLLRTSGMWCNVAITRWEDGEPRDAQNVQKG